MGSNPTLSATRNSSTFVMQPGVHGVADGVLLVRPALTPQISGLDGSGHVRDDQKELLVCEYAC